MYLKYMNDIRKASATKIDILGFRANTTVAPQAEHHLRTT